MYDGRLVTPKDMYVCWAIRSCFQYLSHSNHKNHYFSLSLNSTGEWVDLCNSCASQFGYIKFGWHKALSGVLYRYNYQGSGRIRIWRRWMKSLLASSFLGKRCQVEPRSVLWYRAISGCWGEDCPRTVNTYTIRFFRELWKAIPIPSFRTGYKFDKDSSHWYWVNDVDATWYIKLCLWQSCWERLLWIQRDSLIAPGSRNWIIWIAV